MASSSATSQTSGTKSFLTDPKGVCDDLFGSIYDVRAKFGVDSAHRKTLGEAANKMLGAADLDWSGFSAVNQGHRTSMESAVSMIAGAAGQLKTLLANNNAAADLPKKIALQVKLIKANVNVLENTASLAQLKPRLTLEDMGAGEGEYTSKTDNEGSQMWKKARFKEEIEELVIDASSCGDRFDQGPHQRDNGPGPTN